MSITYTPATNFTAKDSMGASNPDKVLSGVPFDAEFSAISTAFGNAAPTLNATFTGTTTTDTLVATTVNGSSTSNWDTAYGWGDHSTQGYLTTFSESDPTVPSHVKSITTTNVSNWNTAYGWGDHSTAGYLTSESDPVFTAHAAYNVTSAKITNWDSAYNNTVTNMSFNSSDGVLTLTQQDTDTITVDLDGRYATIAGIDTYTAGSGLVESGNEFSHANTSNQASSNNTGQTFIQDITLDEFGHITGIGTGVATDTNTDTTYTAGTGLALAGTVFSHDDTSSQADVNNSGNTFIQDLVFDQFGHVTGVVSAVATDTNTDTTYTAGTGLDLTGTVFSHDDTSTQASVTNANQNFIQSITLDTFGHITNIQTGTASDTNTTYTAGTNLGLSGTTFNVDTTLTGLTDVETSEISIGNYAIKVVGTDLVIQHSGTTIFKLVSDGEVVAKDDVTAFGTM